MIDDASAKILRAIDAIDLARNREELPSVLKVRRRLVSMLSEIERAEVPEKYSRRSGIGHHVVDSWPLNDPVGSAVIDAELAYLQLP